MKQNGGFGYLSDRKAEKSLPDRLTEPSDKQLVRAALDGDGEAYGLLAERYAGPLYGYAFSQCGDADVSADLAQEALIAGYESLDRLKDGAAFGGWLRGILRNKLRNLPRQRRLKTVSLDRLMESGFDPAGDAEEPEFSDEELTAVAELLTSLPEKYREPLTLRYVDGFSYRRIGEFLDLPGPTVATRLSRAKRLLADEAKKIGLM